MEQDIALSPLQQAALDRIHFFEEELQKRGLKVRLAFEQELLFLSGMRKLSPKEQADALNSGFLASYPLKENERGKCSNFEKAVAVLQHLCPALHEIERENRMPEAKSERPMAPVYEAKFDAGHECRTPPSQIALQVLRFRKEAASLLAQHPELMDVYFDRDGKDLSIVIDPLPMQNNATLRHLSHFDENETLGLHSNTSVYDQSGNCLHDNYGFYRACSERLLNLQYKAGLGFIQNDAALKRFGAYKATPRVIGLEADGKAKEKGVTVLERHNPYYEKIPMKYFLGTIDKPKNPYYPDRYLEDRMVGANADPLVITALELAAIYDMVTTRPELKTHGTIAKAEVDKIWHYHMGEIRHDLDHPIEKEMQPWVERFEKHGELKDLLGPTLYAAILEEYGKKNGQAK